MDKLSSDLSTLYPIAPGEDLTPADYAKLTGEQPVNRGSLRKLRRRVRARWIGVISAPKAGDWYLSGAMVEAYRAPGDYQHTYPIAELVLIDSQPQTPKHWPKFTVHPGRWIYRDGKPFFAVTAPSGGDPKDGASFVELDDLTRQLADILNAIRY